MRTFPYVKAIRNIDKDGVITVSIRIELTPDNCFDVLLSPTDASDILTELSSYVGSYVRGRGGDRRHEQAKQT